VANAENKSVSANPFRIGWVMAHNLLKQKVSNWGEAYGCSRMSISDLLNRVGRKYTRCVDSFFV
jgi:hypothetical protein